MANDRVQTLLLRAGVDHAEIQASLRDLRVLQTETANTQGAFERFSEAGNKSADAATDRYEALRKKIAQVRAESENGLNAASSLRQEFTGSASGEGDTRARSETFRAAGGALNQITNSRIGDALVRAGDVLEIQRRATEISRSVGDVAKSFTSAGGAIGAISSAASALAAPLGATAAGLVAIAAPIALLAAPLALVAIQFKHVDDIIQAGRSGVQDAIAFNKAYYEAIAKGSRETLASAIQDKQEQLRLEQARLADLKNARERAFADAKNSFGGDLGGRLGTSFLEGRGAFSDLDEEIKALETSTRKTTAELGGYNAALNSQIVALRSADAALSKDLDEYVKRQQLISSTRGASSESIRKQIEDSIDFQNALFVKQTQLAGQLQQRQIDIKGGYAPVGSDADLQKSLAETAAQVDSLGKTIDTLRQVSLPAAEAEERRKKALADQTELLNKQIAATKDLITANQAIAKLNQDRERVEQDRVRADVRRSTEGIFKAGIAAAKAAEAEEAYQKRLAGIRAEANKRATELAANYQKNEQAVVERFQTARLKVEEQHQKAQSKARESFQQQELAAQDKYNKDRRRLIEDRDKDLLDLAREGDVLAFIKREEQADRDLKKLDEDAADATKERKRSFDEQEKVSEEAYQEQLRDLRTSFDNDERERQKAYQEQLRDLRAQEQERLEQEREGHEQRISQSQKLEEEFAAWQAQQDAYEQSVRRAREDEDFAVRLEAEKTRRDDLLRVASGLWDGLESQIKGFQARITPILNALFPGASGGVTQSFASAKTSSNLQRIDRFETGLAYVPHDMFPAFLDRGERVLTARENQIYSTNSRSVSIGDITIGAGNNVTRADVEQVINAVFHQVVDTMQGAS